MIKFIKSLVIFTGLCVAYRIMIITWSFFLDYYDAWHEFGDSIDVAFLILALSVYLYYAVKVLCCAWEFWFPLNANSKFRDMVETAFEKQMSFRISDKRSFETITVVKQLFSHAQKEVRVFCQCLRQDLWGVDEISCCIAGALERGVDVSIITEEIPQNMSSAINLWKPINANEGKPKFSIKTLKYGRLETKGNFIVVDENSFRYVPDKTRPLRGFTYANNRKLAGALGNYFRKLEEKLEGVQ